MNLTSRVFPKLPRGRIPARCKNRTDPAVCSFVDLAGHGFRVIQVATAVDKVMFGCRRVIDSVKPIPVLYLPPRSPGDVVEGGVWRKARYSVLELVKTLKLWDRLADRSMRVVFGESVKRLRVLLIDIGQRLDAIEGKKCQDVPIILASLGDRSQEVDDIFTDLQDIQKQFVLWPAEAARGTIFSGAPAPDKPKFEAFLKSQVKELAVKSRLWGAADLA